MSLIITNANLKRIFYGIGCSIFLPLNYIMCYCRLSFYLRNIQAAVASVDHYYGDSLLARFIIYPSHVSKDCLSLNVGFVWFEFLQ